MSKIPTIQDLRFDASDETVQLLERARNAIDSLFWVGYARDNPELMAAFMNNATKLIEVGLHREMFAKD